jgi:heterogeneous nuclear ribonucleoprotein A1/A3
MVKKRKLAGGASAPSAQQPKVKTEQREEPVEEAEPSVPVKQEPVEAEENNNVATNDETAVAEGNARSVVAFSRISVYVKKALKNVIFYILVKEEISEEDDDEENSSASIQRILEAFPKDQLVELLRDAAMAHRSVLDQVRRAADVDPAQRKVFVHGLGWDTTSEVLTSAFSPFGEIEDLKVELLRTILRRI